ncbi:hypothetical protein SISSUDRAFT_978972 [Sistotremastrum suecicum HHB10207 ss-3]|uniref:Class E vacuolar protein-sorting machinery protein HSE1 n=1 Tax=Sistotremastrum suecicum HHB10207 ss-3 TaxID=1314776 RepID=A0A166HYT7_9AGAM|nr:hypothetical protein SISSUDRAFT_978972 [Sistotremastrum suecicum HHB10207 ss-3]
MFRAGQPNPYDDIVAKTTDENLTTENWELIITLCDKVNDEGEQGARNVIAALIKRLAHRTSNVQLYALALAEALSKNCGVEVHREIASRAFCQSLEKLITDRMTHDRVRKKALSLIAMWVTDYEDNSSLGMIEETYQSLKAKNYKFDQAPEVPPPQVDDEVRRKEEEELQRALEMSIRDKGGRDQWSNYVAASSSGAGGSGAGSSSDLYQPQVSSQPTAGPAASKFKPASTAYRAQSPQTSHAPAQPGSPMSTTSSSALTRVRALHNFEPTQPGELAFQKGDIIRVIGKEYENWWKGQLKARVGIFPVNYVEVLPEPTAADIQKEAEQEANVFTQAANIDRLLALLRGIDPIKDNLADNEEISELYHHSVALRPKIVKLIDKYSQKRAQLVEIEESFLKARTMYDQMIEDSLARHTGGKISFTNRKNFD